MNHDRPSAEKVQRTLLKLSPQAANLWRDILTGWVRADASEETEEDHKRRMADLPPNQLRYLILLLRELAHRQEEHEAQARLYLAYAAGRPAQDSEGRDAEDRPGEA